MKLLLSTLPVPRSIWRRLGVFRHGEMDTAGYALEVFRRCSEAVDQVGGKSVLELGPGDSIANGLLAHAAGARETYLIDAAPYATRSMALYARMLEAWARSGVPVDSLLGCRSFEALCAKANVIYLTDGLASLEQLPSGSIDAAFSNAVIEHIPRRRIASTLRALRRAMTDSASSYHQIDLKDHLGGALNNLRFPDRAWESSWFARAGFYTNRLGYGELLELFSASGFETVVTAIWRWPELPTPRPRMRPSFRERSDEDLLVSGFDVILRPKGSIS